MAKNCRHKDSVIIKGKLSDFSFSINGDDWREESSPVIGGFLDDEDLEVEICLDCHKILGFSPEDIEEIEKDGEQYDLDLESEE